MSDAGPIPAAPAPAAPPRVRPFYWSVRRELWEHQALYVAPLLVAGFLLFTFFITSFWLPGVFRAEHAVHTVSTANVEAFAKASKAAARADDTDTAYNFVAGFTYIIAVIVAGFHAAGALHGERRDRTILFWKSLPVSDLTTVLAKFAVPMAVTPVIIFGTVLATHLVMLAWGTLLLLAHGINPAEYYAHLHFPFLWAALARGLVIVALWYAPVIAWLMLVSGWARRVPFLWALAPWAATFALEGMVFQTHHAFDFLMNRLGGGYLLAFTAGQNPRAPITDWSQLLPGHVLASPDLWGGLIVAAGLLAAAVRLRRYRDPI